MSAQGLVTKKRQPSPNIIPSNTRAESSFADAEEGAEDEEGGEPGANGVDQGEEACRLKCGVSARNSEVDLEPLPAGLVSLNWK